MSDDEKRDRPTTLDDVIAAQEEARAAMRQVTRRIKEFERDLHREYLADYLRKEVKLRYPVGEDDAAWRGVLVAVVGANAAVRDADGERTMLVGELVGGDDDLGGGS